MVIFIVLWPYLLANKLRCLQRNNSGHTHWCWLLAVMHIAQQCSGGSGGISANAISGNFNLWSLDPGDRSSRGAIMNFYHARLLENITNEIWVHSSQWFKNSKPALQLKYGFCKKSHRKNATLRSWTPLSSQKGTCILNLYSDFLQNPYSSWFAKLRRPWVVNSKYAWTAN